MSFLGPPRLTLLQLLLIPHDRQNGINNDLHRAARRRRRRLLPRLGRRAGRANQQSAPSPGVAQAAIVCNEEREMKNVGEREMKKRC
eukprot:SAG11_NODE_9487_length_907_cov_1.319307_1_plen_87_part_00